MKLILSSLATAALALVASAAPTAPAEVTKDLPARFALYLVTAEARANGLRLQYASGRRNLDVNVNLDYPSSLGVFLGGNGRITLDPTVHNIGTTTKETGAYNVVFYPSLDMLSVSSEAMQAQGLADSKLYPWQTPTAVTWVQDSNGMLRHIDAETGVLQPNVLALCGVSTSSYTIWYDNAGYVNCPVLHLKVVPL